ncbi:MAG: O-antigen ligase family protein [Verrucomicrobiota bacterium]
MRRRAISAGQRAGNGIIAFLPVLAAFLGGGSQKWAEGLVLGLLGLLLLARPPRASLGLATNCVLICLVGLAAVAFLPADWFFLPAWRGAVVNDLNIVLPSTVTPQPWLTAGCLISLIAGVIWVYVVCTQEIGVRSARFQLRLFVIGVVVLAAVCIALYWAHWTLPFWKSERGFGPFPNRNHTADLFGVTAIVLLACGQDDLRYGRKTWLFWLIGLAVLITAIVLDFSRAGIAILVSGSALWIGVVAMRQRSPARLALGFSFLLLLATTLLIFGGQTLERFHLRGLEGPGLSTDFRWRIFHDAFQLIRASPWCGIGLGNFEAVFAIFRAESIGNTRALHPESDWLWLWAELGWPAIVLALIAATLLIRRVFPLQEGTNQRFRLAALIGALIVAAHGLVDVPGHKIGTAFAGIFLLGLSLRRPLGLKPSRVAPLFFRVIGLLLIASGLIWTFAGRKALLPGSSGVDLARRQAEMATRGRNFPETVSLTTHALEWAPLDWQLYFLRAIGEVGASQPAEALEDFQRARFLEPNSYDVPLAEGNIWIAVNPTLATTAWREALRRAGKDSPGVYGVILRNALKDNPVTTRLLEEMALRQPELTLAYLGEVAGAPFNQTLTRFLIADPDLKSLSEPQKLALFTMWSDRGDQEALAGAVAEHRGWLQYAWFGMAKYHSRKNDFRTAYELTKRFGEPAALPRPGETASLEELKKRFSVAPDNYAIGYTLYRKQIESGQLDEALQTVRHFSERQDSPSYFRFLEAEGWAAKENWERAWKAWEAFWLAKTRQKS